MTDDSTAREWVDDRDTLAAALDDFESAGCLLLVLEADGTDAGDAGCRRLLGGDAVHERKRLFVRHQADTHADHHPRTGGERRSLVYQSTGRSAATASPSGQSTTVTSDVDALGDAVEREVDALAPLGGFEEGQLRVCVDALGAVLEDEDLLSVLEFTKALGDAARERSGIAHVHVDQHVPGIAVEGLLPQFDAVVEVGGADEARQRWHLPDESLSTAWLEL